MKQAIVAAAIAVTVGFWAKFDRRWLAQRHLAERLRMLKFRALEQLWCSEESKWYQWVEKQITSLQGIEDAKEIREKIGEWSTGGLIEPDLATSLVCEPDPSLVRALTIYYRFKRVEFQAEYFDRRRKDFKKETGRWLHLNLPLFLISVACVIAHFALEYFANDHTRLITGAAVTIPISKCTAQLHLFPSHFEPADFIMERKIPGIKQRAEALAHQASGILRSLQGVGNRALSLCLS